MNRSINAIQERFSLQVNFFDSLLLCSQLIAIYC